MKKHVVALMFAGLNCAATASWVKAAEDSDTVRYYDPATLVRTGSAVSVAELVDFKRVATASNDRLFRSARSQTQYDCAGGRLRTLSQARFEGQLGEGRALDETLPAGDWEPVELGSARADAFDRVCGSR